MAGTLGVILVQLFFYAVVAAVFLLALYFVIRKGVRDGIKDAENDRRR